MPMSVADVEPGAAPADWHGAGVPDSVHVLYQPRNMPSCQLVADGLPGGGPVRLLRLFLITRS
jgi:hypothetical protein